MKLPVPIRLLKERYFGEAVRNPWVARNRLEKMLERLSPAIVPVIRDAIESLIEFQDPDYALLFLDRIDRYLGAGGPTPETVLEIAILLIARMEFEDPIRVAQRQRDSIGGALAQVDPSSAEVVRTFRWDELVGMLPPNAATTVLGVFNRLGWSDAKITLRFSARTRMALLRLKTLAAMRRVRPFSYRFAKERAWVERWLHMMDRSEVKQPEAGWEVIETARLIAGSGDAYHRGLTDWNTIIDRLVKPVCDGKFTLPDFAAAIRTARLTAADRADDHYLEQVINDLCSDAVGAVTVASR